MQVLTPLAALFAVAAVVPIAAIVRTWRRGDEVRRALGLPARGRRALAQAALAPVLLVALVSVAAAQPILVRQRDVSERSDAEVFVVLDTSRSMTASAGPTSPTRLARAKSLALRLERALPDVPMGIASMTDRTLPNLMPTVDETLFRRTLAQSVAIDRPPASVPHAQRATTFDALVPVVRSNFFTDGIQHRLIVVLTDGEASKPSFVTQDLLQNHISVIYVHVWAPGERIYTRNGHVDRGYVPDPASTGLLANLAETTHASLFTEHDPGGIEAAARRALGPTTTRTDVASYARVPLAPWFVLAALAPLGLMLWRRNF